MPCLAGEVLPRMVYAHSVRPARAPIRPAASPPAHQRALLAQTIPTCEGREEGGHRWHPSSCCSPWVVEGGGAGGVYPLILAAPPTSITTLRPLRWCLRVASVVQPSTCMSKGGRNKDKQTGWGGPPALAASCSGAVLLLLGLCLLLQGLQAFLCGRARPPPQACLNVLASTSSEGLPCQECGPRCVCSVW